MYELRTNDNPAAMPAGTSVISRHRTLQAARDAQQEELARFRRSVYGNPDTWLPRVIVGQLGEVVPDASDEDVDW